MNNNRPYPGNNQQPNGRPFVPNGPVNNRPGSGAPYQNGGQPNNYYPEEAGNRPVQPQNRMSNPMQQNPALPTNRQQMNPNTRPNNMVSSQMPGNMNPNVRPNNGGNAPTNARPSQSGNMPMNSATRPGQIPPTLANTVRPPVAKPVLPPPVQVPSNTMNANARPVAPIMPPNQIPNAMPMNARPVPGMSQAAPAPNMVINPNMRPVPGVPQAISPNMNGQNRNTRVVNPNVKKGNPAGTIITILIILLIIGGTGYYFWSTRGKSPSSDKGTSSANDSSQGDGSLTDQSQSGVYPEDGGEYSITLYYKPSFSATAGINIHYKTTSMATWTTEPGYPMEQSTDYPDFPYKYTIPLTSKYELANVCFNDGTTWDNGGGSTSSYTVPAGTYTMTDKIFYVIDTVMTFNYDPSSVNVFYSGFTSPYIHYASEKGAWTPEPGVAMTNTDTSNSISKYIPFTYTLPVGSLGFVAVCFNDGGTNWDSNNNLNYTFSPGTYLFMNSCPTRFVSFDSYQAQ